MTVRQGVMTQRGAIWQGQSGRPEDERQLQGRGTTAWATEALQGKYDDEHNWPQRVCNSIGISCCFHLTINNGNIVIASMLTIILLSVIFESM